MRYIVIESETLFTSEELAQIDPSIKNLANVLNVIHARLTRVAIQSQELNKMAEIVKGKIFRWYRPITDSALNWTLSKSQYDAMFKNVNKHSQKAQALRAAFISGTQNLKTDKTPEAFIESMAMLCEILDRIILSYLNDMQDVTTLSSAFSALPKELQNALDKHLCDHDLPTLGGIDGLATIGKQHLTQIPVVLKKLSEIAIESKYEKIRAEGEKIKKIIDEKISPEISRNFSSQPWDV